MYSNNQKISLRQTYRLFLFDFMGISTLVIPSLLAGWCGVYGLLSIVIGGVAGGIYLLYVGWCSKKIGTDLMQTLSEQTKTKNGKKGFALGKQAICFLLGVNNIVIAGFSGAVLTGMVRQSLIREESYALIWILTLVVAEYAIWGGLENRARVYEVLFWFVVIPLFIMLLLSTKEIDFSYFNSQRELTASSVLKGAYLVFICFGTLFSFMFFPGKVTVPSKDGIRTGKKACKADRLIGCVAYAYVAAVAILGLVYFLLVGNFGENALAQIRYPIVTLMSNIQITGGFFKRLDAIMLAVWVFTLFALLNLNLYYGGKMTACLFRKPDQKRYNLIVWLLVFVIGMAIGYIESAWILGARFLWYVQTPLYVILPGILAWSRGKSKESHA